jgi:hypothetical protein
VPALVLLAGCGGSGSVQEPIAGAVSAPSGLAVQPEAAADRVCNGGRGASFPEQGAPLGVEQQIASTVLPNGSVLIAYDAGHSLVIQSLTGRCTLDPSFGHGGTATLTRPRQGLWVEAVAPRNGGGAVLAGLYRSHAAVVEVDRHGRIVRGFGHDGRALFPFCAEPTSVLQEPSGRIVVAGGGWIGNGCTGNWAAALFADGRYDSGFGDHGIVPLPTLGADSGVEALTRLPGGNLLAQIGYGSSGCWGYTLRLLQPLGWPVPLFARRFGHFWHKVGFHAFSGSVYTDGKGFTLVGTGQRPCWIGGPFHSKSATGLVVHFGRGGYLAAPPVRFASGMHDGVWALPMGRDTVVATTPYANATRLTLTAVRPDGSLDPRFGHRGRVLIRMPWRGPDPGLEAAVAVDKVGPRSILVLAADGGHHKLLAIRIQRQL